MLKKSLFTLIFALLCNNPLALEYKHVLPSEINSEIENDKSKLKLIFFFTSWCSVCKQSYLELVRLDNKYAPKGLKIYAISLDENSDQLKNFIKKNSNVKSEILHVRSTYSEDVGTIFHKFRINYTGSIPHVVVLDQNGKKLADGGYDLAHFDNGLDEILK